MNKQTIKYMLEDMAIGLKRNIGSTIASISLLFISLLLFGAVVLTRLFIDDAMTYIETQLSMKVYVEDGLVEEVYEVLASQPYTTHVEIEKGTAFLEQVRFFFVGKEHLLEAFADGSTPDAVKFMVQDVRYMETIATNLAQTDGILRVVYPQQMAEILADVVQKVELYGLTACVVFAALAFFVVYMTTYLAMFKREKELRVKLLLGMNPRVVRMQFMLEGAAVGGIAFSVAAGCTWLIYHYIFQSISETFPYIGRLHLQDISVVLFIQLLLACVIAVGASFICTRKWVRHV